MKDVSPAGPSTHSTAIEWHPRVNSVRVPGTDQRRQRLDLELMGTVASWGED